MRPSFLIALLACAAVFVAPTDRVVGEAWTRVYLNGVLTPVTLNDGDSFRIQSGPYNQTQCRLAGYNTLESFGPVHQWGDWHPYELYVNAKEATLHARRGTWHCFTDGSRDGYGRLLVECPDLASSQVAHGLAHAYSVDDSPAWPELLRVQAEAIRDRRGMWAHGVPAFVMTSTHSSAEDITRDRSSNRLISTFDGHSEPLSHSIAYIDCAWICNDEVRVNESAMEAAARRMRRDPELAPLLAEVPGNLYLMEFARRFLRNGGLPDYAPEAAREPLIRRLTTEREEGLLGAAASVRGSCMLYVDWERRYGRDRAQCLSGHGTVPPGVQLSSAHH